MSCEKCKISIFFLLASSLSRDSDCVKGNWTPKTKVLEWNWDKQRKSEASSSVRLAYVHENYRIVRIISGFCAMGSVLEISSSQGGSARHSRNVFLLFLTRFGSPIWQRRRHPVGKKKQFSTACHIKNDSFSNRLTHPRRKFYFSLNFLKHFSRQQIFRLAHKQKAENPCQICPLVEVVEWRVV